MAEQTRVENGHVGCSRKEVGSDFREESTTSPLTMAAVAAPPFHGGERARGVRFKKGFYRAQNLSN